MTRVIDWLEVFRSNRERISSDEQADGEQDSSAARADGCTCEVGAVRSWCGAEMTSPVAEELARNNEQRACPELPASTSFVCSETMFSPKT